MPTRIYFTAENVRVEVDEDPGQVAEALAAANGFPFRLTRHGGRGEVYVNPGAMACWSGLEPSDEPEPAQQPPEAPTARPVTDIWGKPVRRKPGG